MIKHIKVKCNICDKKQKLYFDTIDKKDFEYEDEKKKYMIYKISWFCFKCKKENLDRF